MIVKARDAKHGDIVTIPGVGTARVVRNEESVLDSDFRFIQFEGAEYGIVFTRDHGFTLIGRGTGHA